MSHITDIKSAPTIKNLKALKAAVERYCPTLEFVAGQTHYRTWKDDHGGRLVGDWPLPAGMTAAEIGDNAKHVIRMKDSALRGTRRNANGAPYEIGVVPHPEKPGEYLLMTDFWGQGQGILRQPGVGQAASDRDRTSKAFGELSMYYRMEEVRQVAEERGDTITFQKQADGSHVAFVETQGG